jgi:hypothetical protein
MIPSDEEGGGQGETSTRGTGTTDADIISMILFSKDSFSFLQETCYRLISPQTVNELSVAPLQHRQRVLQQREVCRVMRDLHHHLEEASVTDTRAVAGAEKRRVAMVPLSNPTETNSNESVIVSYSEGGLICVHSTV